MYIELFVKVVTVFAHRVQYISLLVGNWCIGNTGVGVRVHPPVWFLVASAAFVLNWSATVDWAVCFVSVVETIRKSRPEGVVVFVPCLSTFESVQSKFQVALEEVILTSVG